MQCYRSRLAHIFGVDDDEVRVWQGGTLCTFYIAPVVAPMGADWFYATDTRVAITAHTIFDGNCLNKNNAAGILRYNRVVGNSSTELDNAHGPVSYLFHKKPEEIVYAVNDPFGMGSLYISSDVDNPIISSSVEAIAVLQEGETTTNGDYWDTYFVGGSGAGDTVAFGNVTKVPPGCRVTLTPVLFKILPMRDYRDQVIGREEQEPNIDAVIEDVVGFLEQNRSDLSGSSLFGLTGGKDSRFVVAAALTAGIDFEVFTRVPPQLEADIAQELLSKLPKPLPHAVIPQGDVEESPFYRGVPNMPNTPILERAEAWYRYTGGDCWSTPTRFSLPQPQTERPEIIHVCGLGGGLDTQNFTTAAERESGDWQQAVRRQIKFREHGRSYLPWDVRKNGAAAYKEHLLDGFVRGFNGFQALNLTWVMTRYRRGAVLPDVDTMAPKASTALFREAFHAPPVGANKPAEAVMGRATQKMVPEWADVPYYQQVAATRPANEVNKVTIQPTYWEVNRDDFFSSVEQSLAAAAAAPAGSAVWGQQPPTMADVEQLITDLPGGRAMLNYTFEFLFWQYACLKLVSDINAVKSAHPLRTSTT
ncbi:hypothetical protein C1Y63_12020 [Corynebacterium sp. 13CS0277]|nr:hypothetical protein C1Y63_12020 [Corynebacterium sp. 13CS0277]